MKKWNLGKAWKTRLLPKLAHKKENTPNTPPLCYNLPYKLSCKLNLRKQLGPGTNDALPIGTSSKEPKQLAFPPQSLWQKADRVSSHAPTPGSRVPKLRISVLFLPRPARLILPGEGKAGEKEWVGKGQGHPTSASVRGPPKSTNFLLLSATTSVESKHRAGLCRHQDTYRRPAMRFSCILGNVVFCQLWAVSEEAWWEPGLERAELPEEWLSRLGLQCLGIFLFPDLQYGTFCC